MPGPYDLYDTDGSYTSRLPMGLGSEGLMGMWPDLALMGGGFMARRAAIGMVSPRGFEFSGSKATLAMESKFSRVLASQGEGAVQRMMKSVMRGRYTRRPVYSGSGFARMFTGQTRGPAGPNSFVMNSGAEWARSGARRTYYGVKATGDLIAKEEMTAAMRLAEGRSGIAAKLFSTSRWATGWGKALIGMQIGAFALDATRSMGDAIVDWRPRASKPYPYEFGNVFYDPRGAYTQRQRVIMAIHDSQLSTRASLANEASFMHG